MGFQIYNYRGIIDSPFSFPDKVILRITLYIYPKSNKRRVYQDFDSILSMCTDLEVNLTNLYQDNWWKPQNLSSDELPSDRKYIK